MISTAAFLNSGPDDGQVYIGDADTRMAVSMLLAPVMPPACVPGLPDAVVAILLKAHADVICSGKTWLDMSTDLAMTNRAYYRKAAVQHAARAVAIIHALRDAGHHAEADALRAKAVALEEALHAVPADLEERMDLMDAALPGERA